MSKPYIMSPAQPDEVDAVMGLLNSRITWLRDQDTDQWNSGRPFGVRMAKAIERGETWLLRDETEPIGTLTLTSKGDPDFWTPEELKQSALYMGKMATSVRRMGEDLGRLLLSWAQDWAAQSGVGLLRWDAWRTNKKLQDYYRSVGARYVRTEDVSHRDSGALFELDTKRLPDLARTVVTKLGR